MMRNWTGKIIFSDGNSWESPRFLETQAGSLGQAGKKILDLYWDSFSHSQKIRLGQVRLTLTRGEKIEKTETPETDP